MRRHAYAWACALLALVLFCAGCAPAAQSSSSQAGSQQSAASEQAPSSEQASTTGQAATTQAETDIAKTFPSWNPESPALQSLVSFVQDITNEGSANYIAPPERLATFDMDGTILGEKAPVYVDYCILMHRVLDDPTYNAPETYRKTCEQLRANADKGILDESLDTQKNETMVGAFAGMTPEEFRSYAIDFINSTNAEGFSGMTYGESLYKPMVEVIDYLQANEFEVYIVSATEREVARAIATSKLGFEPNHIIGTDYGTKASGQGDEAANKYTFTKDDKVVFDGTKELEVAKMNKVVHIQREIGRRPILAFGNSSGDYAMLNYAQTNPDLPGKGFLILCDDVKREYGDTERATKQLGEAGEAGWTTISMADDWATIYGSDVEKTQLAADAALQPAA